MLNWRDPKNPKSGGAERVTLAYLSALVRRGHDVSWFANDFAGAATEENIEGIHVVRGGGQGTSVFAALRWHHAQPRFDLVIDQHHGIPWYAPWWCGTRSIAYIHEVLGPIWNSFYDWPLSSVGRWQERWTHWFYRDVPFWTPSESTRRALNHHGVRDVTVLPNGVDTRPLPALEEKPLVAPVRLIAVSRLAPNKRVDHAIRATRVLNEGGLAAHLTVVGGGEEADRLKALTAQLNLAEKVTFAGSISEAEKNERLRQAHLLVHASVREGWGLNVIEANAMGTPAVVYPVGGLVDSTVHEQTGLITKAETPEAMASEIVGLVKTPQRYVAFRQAAWERAKSLQWELVLPPACDWLERQARGEDGKAAQ
jgi:glycosyltransferase involved in cell wall biosynthesis